MQSDKINNSMFVVCLFIYLFIYLHPTTKIHIIRKHNTHAQIHRNKNINKNKFIVTDIRVDLITKAMYKSNKQTLQYNCNS